MRYLWWFYTDIKYYLFFLYLKLTSAVREASEKKKISARVGQFVIIECLCEITAYKLWTKSPGKPSVREKVGGEWAEHANFVPRWVAFIKISPSDGIRNSCPLKNFLWKLGLIWMTGDEQRGLREDLAHADCVSQLEMNFFVYFRPADVLTDLVLWCRGFFLKNKLNYQGSWVVGETNQLLPGCSSSLVRNGHPGCGYSQGAALQSWSKYLQGLLEWNSAWKFRGIYWRIKIWENREQTQLHPQCFLYLLSR